MRVGFISDIHGNLLALDAVLADLEQQDVDRVVCLGDICFGPQAHECLERVRGARLPGRSSATGTRGRSTASRRPTIPVGIMLYEIGRWWAKLLTADDDAFVRTFVPTLEVPLENGSTAALLPRLAALVLGLDLLDNARRRRREDVRGVRGAGARRRPHAPADAAPVRAVGDRQPGQRRPAVQPVVAAGRSASRTGPSTA